MVGTFLARRSATGCESAGSDRADRAPVVSPPRTQWRVPYITDSRLTWRGAMGNEWGGSRCRPTTGALHSGDSCCASSLNDRYAGVGMACGPNPQRMQDRLARRYLGDVTGVNQCAISVSGTPTWVQSVRWAASVVSLRGSGGSPRADRPPLRAAAVGGIARLRRARWRLGSTGHAGTARAPGVPGVAPLAPLRVLVVAA
jgi:hypothetical protein